LSQDVIELREEEINEEGNISLLTNTLSSA